jgi:hypothetical protein
MRSSAVLLSVTMVLAVLVSASAVPVQVVGIWWWVDGFGDSDDRVRRDGHWDGGSGTAAGSSGDRDDSGENKAMALSATLGPILGLLFLVRIVPF